MARRAQALDALLEGIRRQWPDRDRTTDGWIGDARHAARASDHNPNAAGHVRAIDVDEDDDPNDERVGAWLWAALLAARDPRCKYVIYQRQMFSSYAAHGYPPWTPRPYRGANAHLTHLHVSVHADPALYDDPRPWTLAPKEDAMPTNPRPLYYAEGLDALTAAAWAFASRHGSVTGDFDDVVHAAAQGRPIVAIGGPAHRTLDANGIDHTAARGAHATDTYRAAAGS